MVTAAQKRRLFRDLDRVDQGFINRAAPFLRGLYDHYFRCETSGWENVPDRKVLFVGNHNGMITYEVLMLFYAWWKRFGLSRRVLGLAHGIALNNPLFRWITPRLGAIPADPEVADEAFQRGYSLLVFPGGEKESFRPFYQNQKVDFFGRKGFIKLALRAKVPIVPVVSVGAQETYIILDRGEELADRLGLKEKFRMHGLPITFRGIFLAWCLATGIFTFFPLLLVPGAVAALFVPLPAKMIFRVLPPIDVVEMVDPELSEAKNLKKIYDFVIETMQRAVDEEYAKRIYPVIG